MRHIFTSVQIYLNTFCPFKYHTFNDTFYSFNMNAVPFLVQSFMQVCSKFPSWDEFLFTVEGCHEVWQQSCGIDKSIAHKWWTRAEKKIWMLLFHAFPLSPEKKTFCVGYTVEYSYFDFVLVSFIVFINGELIFAEWNNQKSTKHDNVDRNLFGKQTIS